ncbi:MAG: hypothetical protein LBV04_04845, partial [Deferribacteraceae bacterium]|nr:hypothetical protein [Deferribacteraceae bacterium]
VRLKVPKDWQHAIPAEEPEGHGYSVAEMKSADGKQELSVIAYEVNAMSYVYNDRPNERLRKGDEIANKLKVLEDKVESHYWIYELDGLVYLESYYIVHTWGSHGDIYVLSISTAKGDFAASENTLRAIAESFMLKWYTISTDSAELSVPADWASLSPAKLIAKSTDEIDEYELQAYGDLITTDADEIAELKLTSIYAASFNGKQKAQLISYGVNADFYAKNDLSQTLKARMKELTPKLKVLQDHDGYWVYELDGLVYIDYHFLYKGNFAFVLRLSTPKEDYAAAEATLWTIAESFKLK